VGSEATLVTVLHADLELVPKPAHTALAVIGFVDVATAADHASALLPLRPLALEGIDGLLIGYQRTKQINARAIAMLPSGGAWLMVQFADDDQARAAQRARAVIDAVSGSTGAVWFDKPEPQAAMEEIREVVLDTGARPPGELRTWPGWEDSAVPPGDYLRDLHKLTATHGYGATSLYGTSATAACIPASHSIYRQRAASSICASSWKPPPTWSSTTAVRSPANTATDRPAPKCCRSFSATRSYRRSVT